MPCGDAGTSRRETVDLGRCAGWCRLTGCSPTAAAGVAARRRAPAAPTLLRAALGRGINAVPLRRSASAGQRGSPARESGVYSKYTHSSHPVAQNLRLLLNSCVAAQLAVRPSPRRDGDRAGVGHDVAAARAAARFPGPPGPRAQRGVLYSPYPEYFCIRWGSRSVGCGGQHAPRTVPRSPRGEPLCHSVTCCVIGGAPARSGRDGGGPRNWRCCRRASGYPSGPKPGSRRSRMNCGGSRNASGTARTG